MLLQISGPPAVLIPPGKAEGPQEEVLHSPQGLSQAFQQPQLQPQYRRRHGLPVQPKAGGQPQWQISPQPPVGTPEHSQQKARQPQQAKKHVQQRGTKPPQAEMDSDGPQQVIDQAQRRPQSGKPQAL